LGTPLNGVPKPWEHFDVPAIMVNAYEIVRSKKLKEEIRKAGSLKNFMNYDGTIYVDSGGYQAMKNKIDIDLNELKEVYKITRADYYFSLDYPSSSVGYDNEKTNLTISNYLKLKKYFDELIPVIHPPFRRAIEEFKIYRRYGSKYVAIGGLVPLVLTSRGISRGRKRAIDLIIEIRRKHNGQLHAMGLGAPTVIPILKLLNFTSTDSASWRIKAAHGKIMLPCGGERYISNRRKAKFGIVHLNNNEKKIIEKMGCPILESYGWEGLKESFKIRALFNAWITLHALEKNNLSGPFYKLMEYTKERIKAKYAKDICSYQ